MERKNTLELNLGGKIRPLRFDFAFLDALVDLIDLKELDLLAKTKPWKLLPIVTTAALVSGAEKSGEDSRFQVKSVSEWVMNLDDPADANTVLTMYQVNMGFLRKGNIARRKGRTRRIKKPDWDRLLVGAYEIGLTREQFWHTTPLDFDRMYEAHQLRIDSDWRRTREVLAMLYNANRGEKDKALSGREIIPLASDPKVRHVKPKRLVWSREKIDWITERYNR